jgi:hypothetical protein
MSVPSPGTLERNRGYRRAVGATLTNWFIVAGFTLWLAGTVLACLRIDIAPGTEAHLLLPFAGAAVCSFAIFVRALQVLFTRPFRSPVRVAGTILLVPICYGIFVGLMALLIVAFEATG